MVNGDVYEKYILLRFYKLPDRTSVMTLSSVGV